MYGYIQIRSHAYACKSDNARARTHRSAARPRGDDAGVVDGYRLYGRALLRNTRRACAGATLALLYTSMSAYIPAKPTLAVWKEQRRDALEYSQARTHRCNKRRRRWSSDVVRLPMDRPRNSRFDSRATILLIETSACAGVNVQCTNV